MSDAGLAMATLLGMLLTAGAILRDTRDRVRARRTALMVTVAAYHPRDQDHRGGIG